MGLTLFSLSGSSRQTTEILILSHTTESTTTWKVDGQCVSSQTHEFSGTIDLESPERGICVEHVAGGVALQDCRLLQLNSLRDTDRLGRVEETYTRGSDVVVTYSPTPSEIRLQIYWRRQQFPVDGGTAVGIQMIVSVQTHLLDVDPSLSIVSSLQAAESWSYSDNPNARLETCQTIHANSADDARSGSLLTRLFRLESADVSYVEIVSEQDCHSMCFEQTVGPPTMIRCETKLFHERLEKGVIRRARIWGIFVPRGQDISAIRDCQKYVAANPLPLTT